MIHGDNKSVPRPRARATGASITMVVFAAMLACPAAGAAERPALSNIFPDFPAPGPHVITGENFIPGATELWTWDPAAGEKAAVEVPDRGSLAPELPVTPPEGARRVQVIDAEPQILVASLGGCVVWAKTAAGFSTPFLLNVARPCWLSDDQAEQGAVLYLFGFGLRAPYRPCRVALVGADAVIAAPLAPDPRAYRTADPCLVHFSIPRDCAPGAYEVYVHNGRGGRFGWQKAGKLEVAAFREIAERVLDVRQFGATGDDEQSDFPAIREAVAAAADGGGVVFFPPGRYRTDATIHVPSGVTLRGASRDNTILEGFGVPPPHGRTTAMIRPASHTRLESLTLQGATFQGPGDYWSAMVCAPPPGKGLLIEDVTVAHCRLRSREVTSADLGPGYPSPLSLPPCRKVRILGNEIYGAANFGAWFTGVYRTEIIGNTFYGGATRDVVTLSANAFDSLVDGNRLVDVPGRFLINPRRHCAIRFNEVHGAFRGTWANAEEIYLVHGSTPWKTASVATAGSPRTLVDRRQAWEPGKHRDAQVLITAGRGFGQHRTVVDNTADTLTVARPWRVAPDSTSEYVVAPMFVENHWFANLNNTPCRMSLWLDCVGNVVNMHRDVYARGIDAWGVDTTDRTTTDDAKTEERFCPCYYNMINDCWLDGTWAHLWSGAKAANERSGPPLFANFVTGNRIRQPHMSRTGFQNLQPDGLVGVAVGNRSGKDMSRRQKDRFALSHSVVAHNWITATDVGIAVSDFARKTFLLDNQFRNVRKPVLDWGAESILRGNRRHWLDVSGEHAAPWPE